jgi:hypothetical protein
MKSTMIILAVLCLLIGGIAGWGIKGRFTPSGQAAMLDITPPSMSDGGDSRMAIYDGGTLTIAVCDADGNLVDVHTKKIR